MEMPRRGRKKKKKIKKKRKKKKRKKKKRKKKKRKKKKKKKKRKRKSNKKKKKMRPTPENGHVIFFIQHPLQLFGVDIFDEIAQRFTVRSQCRLLDHGICTRRGRHQEDQKKKHQRQSGHHAPWHVHFLRFNSSELNWFRKKKKKPDEKPHQEPRGNNWDDCGGGRWSDGSPVRTGTDRLT